jgi:hypothetical protein
MPPTDAISPCTVGRSRLARALGVVLVAGLVPVLALFAPPSQWDQPALLLALLAIALISYFSMVAIKAATFLDAEFIAVLLALALLGPLPALCIWLMGECAFLVLDRRRPEAHLANVSSFGWGSLAGALTLEALGTGPVTSASGAQAFAALVACGVVMLLVNFAITHGLIVFLVDRRPVRATIVRDFVRPAPATLLMIVVGAGTAFLYLQIGVLALALFSGLVLIPQVLLPVLLRPRPASELGHQEAVALYARVISHELKLDTSTRLVLEDAARFVRRDDAGFANELSSAATGHCLDLREAVLSHREHWDGPDGNPGAVGGEMIPLTSRILAVADAWAGLTARGFSTLTHSQALAQLESRAGLHFDPRVVSAVARLVKSERLGLLADTAYAPRLYRVALPRFAMRLGVPADQLGSPS